MDAKPLTLIVRLWRRSEGLRAEVTHLQTDEKWLFRSSSELLEYFEVVQNKHESKSE